jgi:hypothetical protein
LILTLNVIIVLVGTGFKAAPTIHCGN